MYGGECANAPIAGQSDKVVIIFKLNALIWLIYFLVTF